MISLISFLLFGAVLYLLLQQRALTARIQGLEDRLQELSSAHLQTSAADGEDRERLEGRFQQGVEQPAQSVPVSETLAGLFERFVGGRLLIWIGGIALAAAGIFLIRHSIELVTPEARMIAAALFGLLLVAAGEYARRGRLPTDDPRIGQALVGAGIAILYAAAYGSYILFGLIGSGTATGLMLLITGAALALSLRHGAPTAFMGLVGGFLTPLLVGDAQAGALPVLAYLALLDAAIFAIAWRRGWPWLAAAAVGASFAWTGYFILERPVDALPAGLFAALLAIAASLPRPSHGRSLSLMQPAIIGLVELAAMVARPDLELASWLLFGALAAASLPLSVLRPDQRLAPVAALLLALLLIAFETVVGADSLVPRAAAATTLLFAGGSALLATGRTLPALTACAALAGPLFIMRLLQPELMGRASWGGLAFSLAIAAFCLLRLIRRVPRRSGVPDIAGVAAAATAALLMAAAAYNLAPREMVSGGWLVVAVALLLAGVRIPDKALRLAGLVLLTATIIKVFLIDAAALEGVLRILSFLALGIALIGIGKLYTKVLRAESGKAGSSAP